MFHLTRVPMRNISRCRIKVQWDGSIAQPLRRAVENNRSSGHATTAPFFRWLVENNTTDDRMTTLFTATINKQDR